MHAVEVSHLTKEYRLGAMQSLRKTAVNAGARLLGRKTVHTPLFKALDDVSFTVEPGEVVGIIGHNGAGKSTLLKMLSRISTPTSGHVKVNGRIAPLIEVGAGFVGDFTGRENVYLNGAILGMPRKEIDRKFDEIVDFADMAEFIDTPVKRYSSGMQVKLAFAVATSVESEILIVDEVLAVGDLAFQRKCFDRMEELIKRQQRTVLLVSHNIRQVERLCSRTILLSRGKLLGDGASAAVCDLFYSQSDEKMKSGMGAKGSRTIETSEINLRSICFVDSEDKPIEKIRSGDPAVVKIGFSLPCEIFNPTFGVGIHTPDLIYLATQNTESAFKIESLSAGNYAIRCTIKDIPLLPGVYALRLGVTGGDAARTIFYGENLCSFQITNARSELAVLTSERSGFVRISLSWDIEHLAQVDTCVPA